MAQDKEANGSSSVLLSTFKHTQILSNSYLSYYLKGR